MKFINSRTAAVTLMLVSFMVFAAGCIVPYRPYYYDRYRDRDSYHRYHRDYRYDWRRDHRYWDRD